MSMAAKPWMMFYPQDWRADESLRLCSLAARGLWVEMLALMHRSERYGYLLVKGKTPSDRQLAALVGATVDEVAGGLAELEEFEVFSRDRNGTIYSRRMIRDEKARTLARKNGSAGGNPKLKGGYNKPGFIYLIGVRADGAYKIGCSVNPANRLTKIKAQYRGQDLRVIDSWRVDDMGAAEADCHAMFAAKASGEWFFLDAASIGKLSEKFATLKDAEKGGEKDEQKAQSPESRGQSKKEHSVPKKRLADDWKPEAFGEGSDAAAIVAGWSKDEEARQLAAFRDHHKARDNRFADWQAAWGTWVRNSVKFAKPASPSSNPHSSNALVKQIFEERGLMPRAAGGSSR